MTFASGLAHGTANQAKRCQDSANDSTARPNASIRKSRVGDSMRRLWVLHASWESSSCTPVHDIPTQWAYGSSIGHIDCLVVDVQTNEVAAALRFNSCQRWVGDHIPPPPEIHVWSAYSSVTPTTVGTTRIESESPAIPVFRKADPVSHTIGGNDMMADC